MTSLSEIYLSRTELWLLKFIYFHKNHTIARDSSLASKKTILNLKDFQFVELFYDFEKFPEIMDDTGAIEANCYHVSDLGEQFLRLQSVRFKADRRYWITTGIAIVALIKSFLPELTALAERLLK
ncbi:hypothetical protein [Agathobaculum butyriciproducens]|uniref:hypothetical protein n=1 Tax=Agathobaculum butyriciproducens TaxID=1628085 RepID=UPI003AEFBAEA